MTQGYFMEALMDFSVAIKLEKDRKDNADRNENQGMVSSGNKEKDKIHEYYRNAGQANYELAQYNEALQHFESAAKGAPSGHDFFNRGLANMKLGDYEQADVDFKAALKQYQGKEQDPASQANQYKVNYNMGINYRHLDNLEDSIGCFRKAIDFNDSKPAAYNNSGLSNFQFGDYTAAIKDFTAAITKSGKKS